MTQGWPQAQASLFLCCPHLYCSSLKQKARQCAFSCCYYSPTVCGYPLILAQATLQVKASSIQHPARPYPKRPRKPESSISVPLLSRTSTSACFQLPQVTFHAPHSSPACLPLPLWAATLPSLLPKCASLVRPVLQIVQYNPTFAVNFELDLHYCLEIQRPISSCRTHPNRRSLGSSIRRSVWVRVLRDHSNKATSTRRQALLSVAIYGIVPKSLHAVVRASRPKSPEQNRTK